VRIKDVATVTLGPEMRGGIGSLPVQAAMLSMDLPEKCEMDGSLVDNIEDLDTIVGYLAETTRPHGFAISETQFVVFILNASRRLFSDRFFTSSFRPEFYTHLGVRWVMDNGPDGKVMEKGTPNGHKVEVSTLKRVLQRTIPELRPRRPKRRTTPRSRTSASSRSSPSTCSPSGRARPRPTQRTRTTTCWRASRRGIASR